MNTLLNTSYGGLNKGAFSTPDAFITTWRTTAVNETLTIPYKTGGIFYNYEVELEDGRTWSGQNASLTITFPTPGQHRIAITGIFPSIYFNNTGDREKIFYVNQWGTVIFRSFTRSFYGCTNLTILDPRSPVIAAGCPMGATFRNATALTSDLSAWNTGGVTQMSSCFDIDTLLTPPESGATGVYNWDVSNVTNMAWFIRRQKTFDQNLGGWDISNVTNFIGFMFDTDGLSPANYDATLIGWAQTLVNSYPNPLDYAPDIVINFGGSKHTTAALSALSTLETAKASGGYGWTITDGGPV